MASITTLLCAVLCPLLPQTYVLKLSKSGSEGEKVFLLLESGTRFHTVQVRVVVELECCVWRCECMSP